MDTTHMTNFQIHKYVWAFTDDKDNKLVWYVNPKDRNALLLKSEYPLGTTTLLLLPKNQARNHWYDYTPAKTQEPLSAYNRKELIFYMKAYAEQYREKLQEHTNHAEYLDHNGTNYVHDTATTYTVPYTQPLYTDGTTP